MSEPEFPAAALGPNERQIAEAGPTPLSDDQRKAVDAYIQEMTETVIPEIVRAVEGRRVRANLTRQMPLKFGG